MGSKEAVPCINNAFKNFVISRLISGMCKKSKLRVYRQLKEDFECKKYLYRVSNMGSNHLFRFRSGTHGLNEDWIDIILETAVKLVFLCVCVSECESESVEHVL